MLAPPGGGRGRGRGRGRGDAAALLALAIGRGSPVAGAGAPPPVGRGGRAAPAATAPDVKPAGSVPGFRPGGGARPQQGAGKKGVEDNSGNAACVVCLEVLQRAQAVYSCARCYCMFHLHCIQTWATNSLRPASKLLADMFNVPNIWNCPSCRLELKEADYPKEYRCFCGRLRDPPDDPWLEPHSCGSVCGRQLEGCAHTCTQQCHGGRCHACTVTLDAACYCGATKTRVRCGQENYSCGGVCGARLPCGHTCPQVCHEGDCAPCQVLVEASCKCGLSAKTLPCGQRDWSCDVVCGAALACGHHTCDVVCHSGPCPPCALAGPRTCHCGKSTYTDLPCTEPTPGCGDTCGRLAPCGHTCSRRCHAGDCGPCREVVETSCRCGRVHKRKPCFESILCGSKCTRLRNCGRHPCKRRCCPGDCPPCAETCKRKLACGVHTHGGLCHDGPCPPCPAVSRVACACGTTFVDVPCGKEASAKLPPCTMRCRKPTNCRHKLRQPHLCHDGPCPPCTLQCGASRARCDHVCDAPCHDGPCKPCPVMVARQCVGGHVTRDMPCSAPALFKCDAPCGAKLSCGRHVCERGCHGSGDSCGACARQCEVPRPEGCTHPCSQKQCHAGACPPCEAIMRPRCFCGVEDLAQPCSQWTAVLASGAAAVAAARSCGRKCNKHLPGCPHLCSAACHDGACPVLATVTGCVKPVKARCKCGTVRQEMACAEVRALCPPGGFTQVVLECDPVACAAAVACAAPGDSGGEETPAAGAGDGGGDEPRGPSGRELRRRRRQEQLKQAEAQSAAAAKSAAVKATVIRMAVRVAIATVVVAVLAGLVLYNS